MIRNAARAVSFRLLGSDVALRAKLARVRKRDALTILNLHRVDSRQGSAYEAMSPELFERLVVWLKARFRIVLFRDLAGLGADGKPPLILSFDDGYADFASNVMPVLAKHGVSANQNIIPKCVESGLPPMNVMIQDFIGQAPAGLLREIAFPGLPAGADPDNRVRSGLAVSAAFKNLPIADQRTLFAGLERQFQRHDAYRPTPVMTMEELRQVAAHHEIGMHSFEHATMTAETDEYLRTDLMRCAEWSERRLGVRPTVYAFPNGAARPAQALLARELGYEHVLLVGEGFSRPAVRVHRRFTMHGASDRELRFRALGGLADPQVANDGGGIE